MNEGQRFHLQQEAAPKTGSSNLSLGRIGALMSAVPALATVSSKGFFLKRIHLTAQPQNARFVKSFYGLARGVVYSGFDQIFFEPEGRVMYPLLRKDTGAR